MLLLAVMLAGAAPQAPAPATRTSTRHLDVASSVSIKAGKVVLVVDVSPKDAMHVYSPEQKDYIPVSLKIETVDGLTASPAEFPKAEKRAFPALNETQLVYSRPFRITLPVTIRGTLAGTIKGTLRYQACDETICYIPVNVPLTWTLPDRQLPAAGFQLPAASSHRPVLKH